jgi:vacuolar-type H+-ATPase subunit F/Vma7
MSFHIIGDEDTVLGFAFAGAPGTAVASPDEARAAFANVCKQTAVQILIVTEAVSKMIDEQLVEHRAAAVPPYVVEVADVWGTKVEHKTLEEMIQEAVGVRLSSD